MPDLINVFVFPLIVAVFALIIEYWVIQPFKNRRETTINSNSNSIAIKHLSIANIITNFILLTGTISFLLVVFIFLGGFQSSQISFAGIPIKLSLQSLLSESTLSDLNISFSAIIYSCLALNLVSYRLKNLVWFRVFTLFILPSALIALWASIFLSAIWYWYAICLSILNCWLVVMGITVSVKYDNPGIWLALVTFLFPTNALALIYIAQFNSWVAWICSFLFLTIVSIYLQQIEPRDFFDVLVEYLDE